MSALKVVSADEGFRRARCLCLLIAMAGCLGTPMARGGAGPAPDAGDAALLEQVKQLASKGQNAQTAAQVSAYVDQNKDLINAILKGYADHLKEVQAVTADADAVAPAAPGTAAVSGPRISTGLQITGVQPSGGLRVGHLAGYPALPDVDPLSAITQPSAAQLEYAARVQKEMQARKQYLMEHPEQLS
jgi:hypothetical protein